MIRNGIVSTLFSDKPIWKYIIRYLWANLTLHQFRHLFNANFDVIQQVWMV